MNHSFIKSATSDKCAICKQDAMAHTDMATCQSCDRVGPVDLKYGNFLMCKECQDKEVIAERERMLPANQQARVDSMNAALQHSRDIDNSIQVRTDLFNAATVSIVELKSAIDTDDSIANKPYALAEELTKRFNHFKSVVFEMNEKIIEAGNQQKAIQIYLNQLANTLRAEEREKLKISDINYQPKPPTKVKSVSTAKGKFDKKELEKYAQELGVAPFTLQMLVVSKGITVETAANMLRKSINEARSEGVK